MERRAALTPAFAEAPLPDLFSYGAAVPCAAPGGVRRPRAPRQTQRARMRRRFMAAGPAALPDDELLELLLHRALPRGDVAPVARRLLRRFGDLGAVMAAAPERLAEVAGIGPAAVEQIKILEALAHRMARARVIGRPLLSSWTALVDYLRTALAHQATERFRVLYLDRRNVLVADEELGRGTVDHVPVYPREVVKRALALDACALILVHNHPSGDPTPSPADVAMTLAVRAAAEALGITLHDHVVVGRAGHVSFRAEGLL